MTGLTKSAVRAMRPSLVVAEALIDRQKPNQIVDRAQKLGFSPVLTTAVVGVCCGQQHADQGATKTPRRTTTESAQS